MVKMSYKKKKMKKMKKFTVFFYKLQLIVPRGFIAK